MLRAFLFDERESEQVEDWRAALEGLADDQLLALRDPTEDALKPAWLRRCARHDSNMRPLPPQGSALSPELRARRSGLV
jgi:hypothetical protein